MNKMEYMVASVAISLTVGLVLMQYGHGQNSSSMVDKLIEDTKQEIAQETQYRTELINRLENSTCLSEYDKSTYDEIPFVPIVINDTETWKLERILKLCVASGLIK